MTRLIGIDFGTTNSVLAQLEPDGSVTTTRYPVGQTQLDVFRTVLCFWNEERGGRRSLRHAAGPYAVESYLNDPTDSRLIMSMKTYLAQRSFTRTNIFGKIFTLEDMISVFLEGLTKGEAAGAHIVAGRPVRFVGDFGGGTSDFSVMRFDPRGAAQVTPLGYAGVGIAGDSFDYRIIDKVVSPLLGKGDVYTVMGTPLPVPPEYFTGFARWHRLSLMRAPRTLRAIEEVAAASAHPERLRMLARLIEDELGYQLYQTVSAVKAELSRQETAVLRFAHGDFAIERTIARAEFESWIAEDLRRMAAAVDQALANARMRPDEVDRVFLTGGTSFVPAVRALFEDRFGAQKVSGGGEFVSVAEGLALIGRDRAERGLLSAVA
jgi:hypothetical chaperone protein